MVSCSWGSTASKFASFYFLELSRYYNTFTKVCHSDIQLVCYKVIDRLAARFKFSSSKNYSPTIFLTLAIGNFKRDINAILHKFHEAQEIISYRWSAYW